MKYRLVKVKMETGKFVPEEEFVLSEEKGYFVIFNPDCKKCKKCVQCTPDITYYAVPDENGDLTFDEVIELKRKGDDAFRYRQSLKQQINMYDYSELEE